MYTTKQKEMRELVLNTPHSLLFLLLLSVLHVMPVPPAPPPAVVALMHSTCVITFTRFPGAAAKTQTSKEHDMNSFFKETIDIFSSNTSAFILLLEQLLNSCGVY